MLECFRLCAAGFENAAHVQKRKRTTTKKSLKFLTQPFSRFGNFKAVGKSSNILPPHDTLNTCILKRREGLGAFWLLACICNAKAEGMLNGLTRMLTGVYNNSQNAELWLCLGTLCMSSSCLCTQKAQSNTGLVNTSREHTSSRAWLSLSVDTVGLETEAGLHLTCLIKNNLIF